MVSTYDLGHQPLNLASPAAALQASGHDVACWDMAVDPWGQSAEELFAWADLTAVSVPMHTAMRLATQLLTEVRRRWPSLPICLYGLYAPLGADPYLSDLSDHLIAGEYERELVSWVDSGGTRHRPEAADAAPVVVDVGRRRLHSTPEHGSDVPPTRPAAALRVPARNLLPPLDRYAKLQVGDEERLVGYVETSHGCRHRCRHCPVPIVYDGRTTVVAVQELLADVEQLVTMGARHLTYGDPDLFNNPRHALRAIQAVHSAFPTLTFDCTVKVSHVLRDRDAWPTMAASGCLFVVSALESTDDRVLGYLDKGHTSSDASKAIAVLAGAGVQMRPSWLPFTPWTTLGQLTDLFEFLARHDLTANTEPVQATIRLLLPDGSLLLEREDIQSRITGYDAEALSWKWTSVDPLLDDLQAELSHVAEDATTTAEPQEVTWKRLGRVVARAAGVDPEWESTPPDTAVRGRWPEPALRPRLSEPWFCCAEPTTTQRSFASTCSTSSRFSTEDGNS